MHVKTGEAVLQSLRARPGMYFGTTDYQQGVFSVLTFLSRELLDDSSSGATLRVTLDGLRIALEARSCHLNQRSLDFAEFLAAVGEVEFEHQPDCAALTLSFEPHPDPAPLQDLKSLEHARLVGALRPIALKHPGATVVVESKAGSGAITTLTGDCAALALELGGGRSHYLSHPWTFQWRDGDARRMDAALWWANDGGLQVYAVVDGFHAAHGGSHVDGFWRGWARALEARLAESPFAGAKLSWGMPPEQIPWNASLVLSVQWPDPHWGPATRCCIDDDLCGDFVETGAFEGLFAKLRELPVDASRPPWQKMGGLHFSTPWLSRLADDLRHVQ